MYSQYLGAALVFSIVNTSSKVYLIILWRLPNIWRSAQSPWTPHNHSCLLSQTDLPWLDQRRVQLKLSFLYQCLFCLHAPVCFRNIPVNVHNNNPLLLTRPMCYISYYSFISMPFLCVMTFEHGIWKLHKNQLYYNNGARCGIISIILL